MSRARTPAKYANPWNLTPAQEATMDAVCEHGCQKLAARALGIALPTVEAHVRGAAEKMGCLNDPGKLRKYFKWIKFRMGVQS